MIDGVKVQMGGAEYVIPPLTLGSLRKLRDEFDVLQGIQDLGGRLSDDQVDAIAKIVHAALRRNYPEIQLDQMLDLLDLGNLQTIYPALAGISGLARVGPGEGAPQGNGTSAGAISTASS